MIVNMYFTFFLFQIDEPSASSSAPAASSSPTPAAAAAPINPQLTATVHSPAAAAPPPVDPAPLYESKASFLSEQIIAQTEQQNYAQQPASGLSHMINMEDSTPFSRTNEFSKEATPSISKWKGG